EFVLAVTPKGTRSKRAFWKSGFYRIALEADLPLEMGFVDSVTKTFGWSTSFKPTGDVKADMDKIREFYAGKQGIKPELTSVPRLRAEDDETARKYLLSGLH
ncbi:MAG: acyltransferase, partial [Actinomycetaceae bacterium]|nr:acyltransferase [Actinomycetaceae bacterium]